MNDILTLTTTGSYTNYLIAFAAGLLTFCASCLLPLVPTYLAFLSGIALSKTPKPTLQDRWRIFSAALFFVLGFISSFVVIGLALHHFAAAIVPYRFWLERLGGLFFILMGVILLDGVFGQRLQQFFQERRWQPPQWLAKHHKIYAVVTGIAFGSSWTPCIGPVLAVILFWAARQGTALEGSLLLITYGLGIGLPFLLVGWLFDIGVPFLKRSAWVVHYATILSAVIVIWSGVFMLAGKFTSLSVWLLTITNLKSLSL